MSDNQHEALPYDLICIIDTYKERGKEVQELLKKFTEEIALIIPNNGALEKNREYTRELFTTRIKEHKKILVICNMHAGIERGFFKLVQSVEEETKGSIKKILLTCESKNKMDKLLKSHDLSSKKIKYIQFDPDDTYFDKLVATFDTGFSYG